MIRRISYTLSILFTLAFVSSCSTMDDMLDEKQDDATLTVKIAQQDPTTVVTRTISDAIDNINVLVFDGQGHLIGSAYASSSPTSVSVPVRVSSGCTVCAIANTGSSSYFDGISTLAELQAKVTPILASADVLGAKSNEILYGTIPGVTLSSGANTQAVTLRRLYSKYTFTITPSSDIAITGYQLCNVPNECYIASGNTTNPTTGFAGLSFGAVATPVYAGTVVPVGPYYIYENLAGSNSASNTAELRTSGNAPSGSSYLLITARGTGYNAGWTSTYRVYLGGVTNAASPVIDYTNFNINRNFNYQCNIAITGNGATDVRVSYSPTTSTRSNVYFGDATVGTYLYSDGTTGTTTSGKTIVGIVFSNQLSSAEYIAGYKHGYVLALKDVSTSTFAYKTTNDESNLTKVQIFSAYYNDINAGYYGTFTLHYDKSNSTYPAWQAANNYNVVVSGFKNSGWYLPSAGQWWDVCANLGQVDLSGQRISNTSGKLYGAGTAATNVNNAISAAGGTPLTTSYYWSASEYTYGSGVLVYFGSSGVYLSSNYKNDAGSFVRAVLAF